MEFNRDIGTATYRIRSYGAGSDGTGYIEVNDTKYTNSILIMPEKLITPWVKSFENLSKQVFEEILSFQPQVVIIGIGFVDKFADKHGLQTTLQTKGSTFLDAQDPLLSEIISPLTHKGIGVEIMPTPSACRTYTVLMSEGRNVAAGLFI